MLLTLGSNPKLRWGEGTGKYIINSFINISEFEIRQKRRTQIDKNISLKNLIFKFITVFYYT